MTEEERKSNMRMMSIYMGIIVGVIIFYAVAYAFAVSPDDPIGGAGTVLMQIMQGQLLFAPTIKGIFLGLLLGGGVGGLIYIMSYSNAQRKDHYKDDAVAGTGGFMTKKEMREYLAEYIPPDPPVQEKYTGNGNFEEDKKNYSQSILLSKSFRRPIDSRKLIGNNNVLIVGAAGTGKSRGYVKPNVCSMNASYIITDPSGEILYSLGNMLSEHGYRVKIFNISDMEHSNCYNPFAYIRDEVGVNQVIECLIDNTTKGEGGAGDNQFFVDAEKLLYSACIYYLKDFHPNASEKNFSKVMDMINASAVDEQNSDAKSPLDKLFDKLPQNSLAWKNYKAFKQAAGKTLKSIIISCVTRLRPFLTPQVAALTSTDDLELDKIGYEKTALFIITPQADRTHSFLASMLYSQLFETSYYMAEQQKAKTGEERLPIPIVCMMDEFANIGKVPNFPSLLSTMRKYNISANVILQNISQIESMYKDDWKTLVGNCSTILFLGSQEPEVLKYFSEMLGKATIRTKTQGATLGNKGSNSENYQNTGREVLTAEELGRLPSDECIVFTQNRRPVRDKKFKYESHAYYPQTADCDKERGFHYTSIPYYNTARRGRSKAIMMGMSGSTRFREKEQKEAQLKAAQDAAEKTAKEMKEESRSTHTFDGFLSSEDMQKTAQKLFMKAMSIPSDDLCIIEAEGIPLRYLSSLIEGICVRTERPYVLLIDTFPDSKVKTAQVMFTWTEDRFAMTPLKELPYVFGWKIIGKQGYFAVNISKIEDLKTEIKKQVELPDAA